jgi:hypothetical protein
VDDRDIGGGSDRASEGSAQLVIDEDPAAVGSVERDAAGEGDGRPVGSGGVPH